MLAHGWTQGNGHSAKATASCVCARGWYPARKLLMPTYNLRGSVARERPLAPVRALRSRMPQCRILGIKADLDGGDGLHEALFAAGPHAGEALQKAAEALRRARRAESSGSRLGEEWR
jgi:hypothetical protein